MWQVISKSEINDHHWDIWQSLNDRFFNGHPLLDVMFIRPLLDCFGGKNLYLAIHKNDHQVTAAILIERTGLGVWQLFSPSQSSIAPIIMDPNMDGKADFEIRNLAKELPGAVWLIDFLKLDPDVLDLQNYLKEDSWERLAYSKTVNINVEGDFDSYWSDRGKKQRQNINRPLKKLERQGLVPELLHITNYNEIEDAIKIHAELEGGGWKGKQGTAILKDNIQGKFYTQMLQNFAKLSGAYICQLIVHDRVIASLLNIYQNGMMVILKTSYCESMAEYSPGRLIDYLMLPAVFKNKAVKVIELYTNASSTDEKWATGSRELYHLNFYLSPLSRCLIHLFRFVKRVPNSLRSHISLKRSS